MGVYARNHAQQMVLDGAIPGEKSNLSPRAQLLLLHIALQFGGDQEIKKRDITKGTLWNRDAVYMEGLGRKARAIGYNVPEKIDLGTVQSGALTERQHRATKSAVSAAILELVAGGYLTQTKRGQTGQTPEYALRFLGRGCAICKFERDGEKFMDQTLHLSPERREQERDQIDQSREDRQG